MKSSPVHVNINNDNILQIQIIWTNTIAKNKDKKHNKNSSIG